MTTKTLIAAAPITPRFWLNILLTLLSVGGVAGAVIAFRSLDYRSLISGISSFSPAWIVAGVAVSTAQVFCQLIRAWVSFPAVDRPKTFDILKTTAVGQLFNSVTPLRSGDAFKILRFTSIGTPVAIVVAALFAERLADNVALAGLATWSSFSDMAALVSGIFQRLTFWNLTVGSGLLLVAIVLSRRLTGVWQALGNFGLRVGGFMKSPRFFACFAIAIFTWIVDAGTLFCTAHSGGVSLNLPQAMSCIFLVNLGIAIPLTVANVGVYEATLAFALTTKGVPTLTAIGIATVEHAVKLLGLVACVACLSLWRKSPSLPSVTASIPVTD